MAATATTDWDDRQQVELETKKLLGLFPHLKECASADGDLCPLCGSDHVELRGPEKHFTKNIKIHRCLDCHCGYTQYRADPTRADDWGLDWRPSLVTYALEGYPFYVYFKAGTNLMEGIGPGVFPWEQA